MRVFVMLLAVACTGPTVPEQGDTDPTGVDTDDTDDTGDTGNPDDIDGDGYPADEDCDDLDPRVNPGVAEVAWNNVDDDCDGVVDADGALIGDADIQFRATIEGRNYRWDLDCPAVVTRTGWQITLTLTCHPPEGDELARLAIGETLTIRERDNIAEDARYGGVITVSSSDGWSVDGVGSLTWTTLGTVEGAVSMTAVFARLGGTLSAVR